MFVRSTLSTIILVVIAGGCSVGPTDVPDPAGGSPDAAVDFTDEEGARAEFESTVLPLLRTGSGTCASCHEGDAPIGPGFLVAEPDVYSVITTWSPPLLDCVDAASSRLLVYPGDDIHPGGPPTGDEMATIVDWIERWARVSPACEAAE